MQIHAGSITSNLKQRSLEILIAEVVFTGTELLLGQILNTNARHLQQALASNGIDLYHQVTVGDNLARCAEAIRQAAARAEVIFIGGGLGPTEDDISREALSLALDVPLIQDPGALAIVRRFYLARDIPMPGVNLRQALIPAGGTALDNPVGTAPGIALEHGGKIFFLLPGPPPEFNRMLDEQVLPCLFKRFPDRLGTIHSRVLKVGGMGESILAEKLGDLLNNSSPTLAPCAKEGEVHLRITAKAAGKEAAGRVISEMEQAVRQRLEGYVFGADEETLPSVVGGLLLQAGLRVSLLEAFTGGQLAHMFISDSTAREVLTCGLVLPGYTPGSPPPEQFLEVLPAPGADVKKTVGQMAAAARRRFHSGVGIATAGPAQLPEQARHQYPVGIAVDVAGNCQVREMLFWGSCSQAARRAAGAALFLLWQILQEKQ
jgi:nicotinamide-nucleotide amidase